NGEPEKVGVTIHYVDEGIDTGPIIRQESVPVHADDTLATLAARCVRRGTDLYIDALRAIATGTATAVHRDAAAGRAYYSIDLGILQYLIFRWRFWRLARRLPRRPAESPGPRRAQ
ncbi:MAG: hypothetical protein JSR54_06910, partial [Proteobacteria bacterium]|nr:hypothetical protein [Pseudomonadota bacterium]